MGKKRKSKRKSARGHVKGLANRYREYRILVPLDRNNEPINTIPSERKALAKAMLEQTGSKTTSIEQSLQPEPDVPDNVVSMTSRRPKVGDATKNASNDSVGLAGKASSAAANEEQSTRNQDIQASTNYDRLLYHQWSNERNHNAAHTWAKAHVPIKEREAVQMRRWLEFSAAHPEGMNPKPIISMMHNPGISPTPIYAIRPADTPKDVEVVEHGGYIPKPMFIVGVRWPPTKQQQSPEVRPHVWPLEEQLYLMMALVDEYHWPEQIKPYIFKDGAVWRVHTGKVRGLIRDNEDRTISRCISAALLAQTKDHNEQRGALEEDVKNLQAQRRILEYQLSHQLGEEVHAEQIEHDWLPQGARTTARGMPSEEVSKYATAYAKPPDDIGKLVAEFKLFNQRVDRNGINRALARQKYGDYTIADRVEEQVQDNIKARTAERTRLTEPVRIQAFLETIPILIQLSKERKWMVGLSNKHSHVAREQFALWCIRKRVRVSKYKYVKPYIKMSPRIINKALNVQHWSLSNPNLVTGIEYWGMKYEPIEKTLALDYYVDDQLMETYRNKYACYTNRQTNMIRRWEERLEYCFNWADKIQSERNRIQSEHEAKAEIEEFKRVQNKPINKFVNKVISVGRKLKQLGDRDVFVTPWEQLRRDEELRILSERTKKEEAESQAESESLAKKQARRTATKARRVETKAKRLAEQRHKELAKKIYRHLY